MNEPAHHLPSGTLFRSFLLVAGGYLLCIVLLMGLTLGLAYAFFPATVQAIGAEPIEFERQIEHNAAELFPIALTLPLVLLFSMVCFGIGWGVARLAPFAKFGHGLFLSAILFVSFLQAAITGPDGVKGMILALMIGASVGALTGARWISANGEGRW